MKKAFITLLCLIICVSCFNKKEKEYTIQPTVTVISETVKPRENVIPLYVEEIPFESSWTVFATDGNANSYNTYNNIVTEVLYPGENLQALGVYREGIPFSKGSTYRISFDSESTINRKMQVVAGDENGNIFLDQSLDIGGIQNHQFEIKINSETTWNGKLSFNFGNDGSEGMQTIHTITLSNVLIETDDVDTRNIKINQVGYLPTQQKKFVAPYNVGDYYNVIDTKTNTIVYSGVIGREIVNEGTGETNYVGNFSEVTTPGTYKIQTQVVSTSYEFVIESFVYDSLLIDSLRMMSLQRSGVDLSADWAKGFARKASHTDLATVYGTEDKVDVSGGWYDAGDYGRYIKTGSKAVMDLMLAYSLNPQYFNDNYYTIDSNNGISDILDEARHELEWMLKMQTASGGVYNKVVSSGFAGYVSPEDDLSALYVLPVSTNATGDFAGVMAYAYTVFKDIDNDFANKCLDAGLKAWQYLEAHPEMDDPLNPENMDAGEYRDDSDKDERFFALASLFNATNDMSYLEKAKVLVAEDERVLLGLNWQTVGTYGEYLILQNNKAKEDSEFYQKLYLHLMAQADNFLNYASTDGYYLTIQNNYNWGSNMDVANNGMLLMLADSITPNDNYVDRAFDQLHYILGRNSLNMSFVTGYGENYPKNIHNRITIAKNLEIFGAMVGGPNRNLEDPVVQGLFNDTFPPAKIYVDDNMSYSTNEVAIYWNSALIFLISSLKR